MTDLRVFELAKELNMPSKQLIQKIRSFGITIEGNFSELNGEEANFIRQSISGSAPSSLTKSEASAPRRGKIIRRAKSAQPASETELSQDKKPRRLRKLRKNQEFEEPQEPQEVLQETITPDLAPQTSPTETFQSADIPESTENENESEKESTPENLAATDEKPIEVEQPSQEPEKTQNTPPDEPQTVADEPKTLTDQKTAIQPNVDLSLPNALDTETGKNKNKKTVFESPELQENKKGSKGGKEGKRDKKGARFSQEGFTDSRAKKPVKKISMVKIEEEEVEVWERPRKKKDRKNKSKVAAVQETKHTFNPRKKSIKIGSSITVGELAGAIGIKVTEIIKKLMSAGTMASINQVISGENAALVAADFNIDVELDTSNIEDVLEEESIAEEVSRGPIVTIMGHVDHGKTSLLDKIRSTHVTQKEAGGITQHIGAYHVETDFGAITFLDTPGHEAFTAMRARGANITDIVILVVAADDGVQPQTIEAIHHAQAAEVPIIVAVNKIDRPDSNPMRVQQELLGHNLVAEDLGGETIFAHVSAKSGEGIKNLLEMVQLQAEILELKAPASGNARGVIIESQISKGRGPVGTVLIQKGTLTVGDHYVVGETFGKVRAMFNDRGQAILSAKPSIPAEVLGFNNVPTIGEQFIVIADEKTARQIAESRAQRSKDAAADQQQKLHLENLFNRISSEEHVELKILIKADVQGSVEALQSSLSQIGNEQVSVRFIHTAVGNVTETDVMLASASDAIIIGFNTNMDNKAKIVNGQEDVDVRLYTVIYDAIEDVRKALEGLLKPTLRDEVIGRCEVRQLFNTSKEGKILGCYVTEGKLLRDAHVRILRDEDVVHSGDLTSLRRFKDDVREVPNNYECGIVINYPDVQIGDIIEAYIQVEESARL